MDDFLSIKMCEKVVCFLCVFDVLRALVYGDVAIVRFPPNLVWLINMYAYLSCLHPLVFSSSRT